MRYLTAFIKRDGFIRSLYKAWCVYPLIGTALATLMLFVPFKVLMEAGVLGGGVRLSALCFLLLAAFFLRHVGKEINHPSVSIFYRGIVSLFIVYLFFAAPSVLPDDMMDFLYFESILYKYGAVIVGILALWRISWTVPFLIMVKWHKYMMSEILGFRITVTDYAPVIETGIFVALGYILVHFLRRRQPSGHLVTGERSEKISPVDAVFLTAVAVHFSNYFYSGVEKIRLSENPFSWVIENPTHFLSYIALHVGALPLSLAGDAAALTVLEWLSSLFIPLNVIVLLSQLVAVYAVTRVRAALLLTVFFDIMHVLIFILSGIFFYKWIFLNLLIVFSLERMKDKVIPPHFRTWLLGCVICAPLLFFVAFLGWYDTPAFNDQYIEAITDDGEAYRVPYNYMMSSSVVYAQQRLVGKDVPAAFETATYATISAPPISRERLERAWSCLSVDPEDAFTPPDYFDGLMKKHHRFVLENLDGQGRINYDFYPHHIFSMPWEYKDFYILDKRKIVGYRYVINSTCLDSLRHIREDAKSVWRAQYYIDVR